MDNLNLEINENYEVVPSDDTKVIPERGPEPRPGQFVPTQEEPTPGDLFDRLESQETTTAADIPSGDHAEDPDDFREGAGEPPSDIDSLLVRDPFEGLGLDTQRAYEIFATAGVPFGQDDVPGLVEHLKKNGLEGEDGARDFAESLRRINDERERKQAEEDRLSAIEERLERGAGSPLDDRLSRIEQMLTEQKQVEQAIAAHEAQVAHVVSLHAGAMNQLVQVAARNGHKVSEGELQQMAQLVYETGGLNAPDPYKASLVAWRHVTGKDPMTRHDPRREAILRPVSGPGVVVPIRGHGAAQRRTIDDLLASDPGPGFIMSSDG